MGVDYFAYLQTYIHDEPIAIGPFVKTKDGECRLATVLEARSAFREACEWLQERPHKAGLPEKLCPELYKKFCMHESDPSFYKSWEDYYKSCMSVFRFSDIKGLIKKDKPYKYQAYITKEQMALHECGEDDEICFWLTKEEYESLSEEEKREYAYYEWNDYFGAYGGVSTLVGNINAVIYFFEQSYCLDWDFDEINEAINNLEVLINVSW